MPMVLKKFGYLKLNLRGGLITKMNFDVTMAEVNARSYDVGCFDVRKINEHLAVRKSKASSKRIKL